MAREKDNFTRKWIIENSVEVLQRYEPGMLTLRGLYYQLVSLGMTNSTAHYKRVVSALIDARWDGIVDFDAFSDRERVMVGTTDFEETRLEDSIERGKKQVKLWMEHSYKNTWENQPYYPEVFIEKKALQGVFESVCYDRSIALGACKGYPSLTFLNEAAKRLTRAEQQGKKPVILYFGDYDPSGEDIPRAVGDNIRRLGCESVEVRRIALMHEQVLAWELPPAPVKLTDSRAAKWDGIGQVELDAVEPRKLQRMCQEAIDAVFDDDLHEALREQEKEEGAVYRTALRRFVNEEL
jgi:hypothetical protein